MEEAMQEEVHHLQNELASRLQSALILKKTGVFLAKGLLFISVPKWAGWKHMESEMEKTVDHFARWEFFFLPDEGLWVFLRITWVSIPQILLAFFYPDDYELLEEIALHRRLALLDLPLLEGQPDPLSKGVLVHNIPVDLLRVLDIGSGYSKNVVHWTH